MVPIGTTTATDVEMLPIGTFSFGQALVLPIGITMTEAERLGEALRKRRKTLGLSQDDVAAVVGVNRRVVGELERGKATVQLDIVLRVAGALGLDVDLRER